MITIQQQLKEDKNITLKDFVMKLKQQDQFNDLKKETFRTPNQEEEDIFKELGL